MNQLDIYQTSDGLRRYKDVSSIQVLANSVTVPFFSIIIPTYKRPETLGQALHSALAQGGFDDYEIIVVNNDPEAVVGTTRDIVESFGSEKISYYVNAQNIGVCGNWNRAVELARGKYIVMLHDDDLLGPDCLRALYQTIQVHAEPGMVGCGCKEFTSEQLPVFEPVQKLKHRIVTKKSFFFGRYIGIAGMTFRKDLAVKVGGFAEEFNPNLDTVFIYQMLLRDIVINIDNKLVGYRKGGNTSLSDNFMQRIIMEMEQIRRSIAEHELFAKVWMSLFGKEFLYQYVNGANTYWSLQVDYREIFDLVDIPNYAISKIKLKLMNLLLRIESFSAKFIEVI